MHAWKLFRKHHPQLNLFFQPAKEWTPENEISCQWRGGDITFGLRWKPNDTCPSLTSLSWHPWEPVKFSEDLFWEPGDHLWVHKVTSLGPQVKSLQNGERPPCHINSYQWHLPSDNQLICDSRLSTRQKSLAGPVCFSCVFECCLWQSLPIPFHILYI